jgi:hypothetical protein
MTLSSTARAERPRKGAISRVAAHARDALLLDAAVRRLAATSADRQATVRAYHDAALRRATIADQLVEEQGALAAVVLYREALPLLVAAIAVARDATFDPRRATKESPWDILSRMEQDGALPPLAPVIMAARDALAPAGPLELDGLPPEELLARRTAAEAAIRSLRALVDARTLPELRAKRRARVGAALALVLAALALLIVSVAIPRNLALHKPVTASSRHPGSIAPADNSGLVNGEIETTYGIHTAPGSGWVMVDLLAVEEISEVRIFNRAEALFDAGLPFMLELSIDGLHFFVVEQRTQPFSISNPWSYKAPHGTRARFVRVRSNSFVALTELEVY